MQTDEIIKMLNQIEKKIEHLDSKFTKPHLKTKDACEFMSCSPNTLNKICIEYDIYPIKIAGVNYYNISDLQNLFNVSR